MKGGRERERDLKSQPFLFNDTEKRSCAQSIMKIVQEVLPQQISSLIGFKPKLLYSPCKNIERLKFLQHQK